MNNLPVHSLLLIGTLPLSAFLIFTYKGQPLIIMKRGIHTEVEEGHFTYNDLSPIVYAISCGEVYRRPLVRHADRLGADVAVASSASPHTWYTAQR